MNLFLLLLTIHMALVHPHEVRRKGPITQEDWHIETSSKSIVRFHTFTADKGGPGEMRPLCWVSPKGDRWACARGVRLPIPKELQ